MRIGLRIGRIAGVDVNLDWSLLIVFVLITVSLASALFPQWHPDWSAWLCWGTALVAATLFFFSVLLHELSHALVGRRFGIDVKRIILFVFGGMAQMEDEPRHWRGELAMAIVGPITSLFIGGACSLLVFSMTDTTAIDSSSMEGFLASLRPVPTLLLWLGQINILLALFNMVPAFPLDGGRVLRATLWGMSGNLFKATRWASGVGQAFAWILIGSGIAMMLGIRVPVFGSGFAGGLWITFIGWFLNNAAVMGYRQMLIRVTLQNVPVTRLMRTAITSVPAELPVEKLVGEYILRSDQRGFPVLADEQLIGMVSLQDIRKLDRNVWQEHKVGDIMTPADKLIQITADEDAPRALALLSEANVNQIPVVDNGRVRGLISREDIMKWLLYSGVTRSWSLR
jgi:Zn-dependent protease/predicted transcriptional regulator